MMVLHETQYVYIHVIGLCGGGRREGTRGVKSEQCQARARTGLICWFGPMLRPPEQKTNMTAIGQRIPASSPVKLHVCLCVRSEGRETSQFAPLQGI